ncbi:MAG: pyridoxamine 5'-phosphate oxidase family protein [Pseudomonadota bacterium]
MSDDLPATLSRVWTILHAGVTDAKAPARFITLATVGQHGAEARLLVLRAADEVNATVTFHTDARTAKVAEIAANPNATALIWDPAERFQIRLRLTLTIRPGTAEEWSALSHTNQHLYGGTPAPGAPLDTPEAHTITPDATHFAVLTGSITEIETLHLGQPHRRARFSRDTAFAGQWITP